MDLLQGVMQWAVCVQFISNAVVSYFSNAFKLGHGQECHQGHMGHQCALVLLDLECTAHDAHLLIHFSWWSAAVEVEVSIPPTVDA